ncbi:MAG: serine protease, partial [Chloroflexota bacterium]
MKPLSLITLILVLFTVPLGVFAQDVSEGDIEEVAASVVLIEAVQGSRALSGGSGTIISPDGIIYTNRHVIEDGSDFAIYMLDDIREQPVLRYYATLQYVSNNIDVDFAILKIDRDSNQRPIDATAENLPYLPAAAGEEVNIGERIRIFGYPGIGEGYMVVTAGEVVTIQNGSIGGNRLPVWYWTDAEISGGNSGGLAVNENGEWVGLPTWVVSEDRTAGRLGGILPLIAVEALLANEGYVPGSGAVVEAPPVEQPPANGTFTLFNESNSTICYVYISPTTAADWGDDQLGALETVNGGESREFRFAPGDYDMLLLDCDGETLQDSRSLNVSAGTIITYNGQDVFVDSNMASLTLTNDSATAICYVYISPSDSNSWGDDRLGNREIVRAGTDRTWDLPAG